ncbi:unnamed protein product [Microthlaspi erraticum]|uniref:Uncharacterized protein n=1 Tax=Microthlaspi erraticum TaxID=1685480 RepID=A0A6D2JWW8_9BRAS|nr:unnamed protein product [Microthlaspi erraticum]
MRYRDFSSRADVFSSLTLVGETSIKEYTTSTSNIVGRLVKLAFGGVGYGCGVLTVDPVERKCWKLKR